MYPSFESVSRAARESVLNARPTTHHATNTSPTTAERRCEPRSRHVPRTVVVVLGVGYDVISAVNSQDCDDSNAATYSGATEVCNGFDDDCDGSPLCQRRARPCSGPLMGPTPSVERQKRRFVQSGFH